MAYSLAEGLFTATLITYALSLSHYIWQIATRREWVKKAASFTALAGFAFHTGGLIARYVAAGIVEVEHRRAVGEVLTGLKLVYTYIMHPPYTNLYESMVFVAWALMLCYLIVERKFTVRPLGIFATGIAVLVISLAGFATQKEIEPLVPALQSWWILIHVWFVFLAYALFALASFSAVLYLIKNRVDTRRLGGVLSLAGATTLALVGGKALFTRLAFEMVPMGWHNGKLVHVTTMPAGAEKAVRWYLAVPGAGPLLLLAVVSFAAAGFLLLREARRNASTPADVPSPGFWAFVGGLAALTAMMIVVGLRVAQGEVDAALAPPTGVEAPYSITWKSNQYALALCVLVWGLSAGWLAVRRWRERVEHALPEPRKLDDMTYRVITAGFPLLTVGIVLGGVWAYFSWGRFWGWDPKETWSLVTWTVYAMYLHTRITYGWAGNRAAAIAVAGFAVVIFTYMGVNLGLTGDGLHTYGGG